MSYLLPAAYFLTPALIPPPVMNDKSAPLFNATLPVKMTFYVDERNFNMSHCKVSLTGRTPGDPVYASIVSSPSVSFIYVTHERPWGSLTMGISGSVNNTEVKSGSTSSSSTLSSTISSSPTSFPSSSIDQGTTATTGIFGDNQPLPTDPLPTPNAEESKPGPSLGPTALAGIGAGAGVAVVAIAAICFFFFWRARQKKGSKKQAADADESETPASATEHRKEAKVKVEELYGEAAANRGAELYSPEKPQELESGTMERHEIGGGARSVERIELP